LHEFRIKSEFGELPVALYGHSAPGFVRTALQDELQIIQNITGVTRLKMQFRDCAEVRLKRELSPQHLRKKCCGNLVGEGVTTTSRSLGCRSVPRHC
jgi:hypothetical protein